MRRALRRLLPSPPHPPNTPRTVPSGGQARSPLPAPGPAHRASHSLLGRAPHRNPRWPAGRRLPALRRRGPRLPCRLLGTASSWPRSGLRHRPPTHGATAGGGGAAGLRPPPSDPEPLPSGRPGRGRFLSRAACPPASDRAQDASARVTAARPLTSHPRRRRRWGGGGRRRPGVLRRPACACARAGVERRETRGPPTRDATARAPPLRAGAPPRNSPERVFQVADCASVSRLAE